VFSSAYALGSVLGSVNKNVQFRPVGSIAALSKNLQVAKRLKYSVSSSRLLSVSLLLGAKEHSIEGIEGKEEWSISIRRILPPVHWVVGKMGNLVC